MNYIVNMTNFNHNENSKSFHTFNSMPAMSFATLLIHPIIIKFRVDRQSFISTLSTFVDEITLLDKVVKKQKKIVKAKKNIAYWSKEQINTLVELLRKYGSDFTMIATQMTKTRDQIRRKFKVLQKKNLGLAEAIFQKEISNQTLKAIVGQMEIQENDFLNS